jgi:membrane complex biogenesis BtpA family protein
MRNMPLLDAWSSTEKPIIGVIHAPALPGAPRYRGNLGAVLSDVLRDAEALVDGGVDGLLLENFGDAPFYPRRVSSFTATHMTSLAIAIRRRTEIPLGVNVLRNDGQTALSVAHASGAEFIRVNVLTGARVTDQGVVEAIAHDLLRDRRLLGAEKIKILADVGVKHSTPLGAGSLEQEVVDVVERGGADGVIVTGASTGKAASIEDLQLVRKAAGGFPVFVGSGLTAESVEGYRALADGFIVGSFFKEDGKADNAVELSRVRMFVNRFR